MLAVLGAQGLPRGARVRVKLGDIDEVALDVRGTILARLDLAAESDTGQTANDVVFEEDEDDSIAGPITIAVDVNEADSSDSSSGEAATLAASASDHPSP